MYFENYWKTRIIFSTEKTVIYDGNNIYPNKIYLLYHNNHFDSISSVKGFLQTRSFCEICLKGYANQHKCGVQIQTNRKTVKCENCDETFLKIYQKKIIKLVTYVLNHIQLEQIISVI